MLYLMGAHMANIMLFTIYISPKCFTILLPLYNGQMACCAGRVNTCIVDYILCNVRFSVQHLVKTISVLGSSPCWKCTILFSLYSTVLCLYRKYEQLKRF